MDPAHIFRQALIQLTPQLSDDQLSAMGDVLIPFVQRVTPLFAEALSSSYTAEQVSRRPLRQLGDGQVEALGGGQGSLRGNPSSFRGPHLVAEHLLNGAVNSLGDLKRKFLHHDLSEVVRRTNFKLAEDPKISCLYATDTVNDYSNKFRELLYVRSLSIRRRASHLSREEFIRNEGLPSGDKVKDKLKMGDKSVNMELQTKNPGLSVILMPVGYLLKRLVEDEQARAVGLLHQESYQELMNIGHWMTDRFLCCQLDFDDLAGEKFKMWAGAPSLQGCQPSRP